MIYIKVEIKKSFYPTNRYERTFDGLCFIHKITEEKKVYVNDANSLSLQNCIKLCTYNSICTWEESWLSSEEGEEKNVDEYLSNEIALSLDRSDISFDKNHIQDCNIEISSFLKQYDYVNLATYIRDESARLYEELSQKLTKLRDDRKKKNDITLKDLIYEGRIDLNDNIPYSKLYALDFAYINRDDSLFSFICLNGGCKLSQATINETFNTKVIRNIIHFCHIQTDSNVDDIFRVIDDLYNVNNCNLYIYYYIIKICESVKRHSVMHLKETLEEVKQNLYIKDSQNRMNNTLNDDALFAKAFWYIAKQSCSMIFGEDVLLKDMCEYYHTDFLNTDKLLSDELENWFAKLSMEFRGKREIRFPPDLTKIMIDKNSIDWDALVDNALHNQ